MCCCDVLTFKHLANVLQLSWIHLKIGTRLVFDWFNSNIVLVYFLIVFAVGNWLELSLYLSPVLLLEQSKEFKENWTGTELFEISVLGKVLTTIAKVLFLKVRVSTRPWLQPILKYFWYFLTFYNPGHMSYVVRQLLWQFTYKYLYSRFEVLIYLCWIKSIIKSSKVAKYYDQSCGKYLVYTEFFSLFCTVNCKQRMNE